MTMFPSACVWAYRTSIADTLRQIKQTAFHYVDVGPDTLDAPGALEVLKDLGLKVFCVALDRTLPPDCSLDGKNEAASRKAMDYIKRALQRSQDLGAKVTFVRPCSDRKHLKAFGANLMQLADDAQNKGIKLCVEHVPGSALSAARETLSFLEGLNHPNLYLLLDIGHTILSNEKPWEIIASAGKRLGYIQMDDNDGKHDRHWPVLDGRITHADLAKILDVLTQVGYEGTLGLQLSQDFASLISGFSKNRNLLLRMQASGEPKSLKEPEARRKP